MMERDKDHFDVGPFTCRPSVIHASHIREYRESVVHDDRPLWLSVKQYTPKAQGRAGHGAVSIVAAVGNGFAKVSEVETGKGVREERVVDVGPCRRSCTSPFLRICTMR